tara:strand:+ start:190 stop:420 length:231 start_codon:yes stop_codon:yes gene_type:complete
MKDKTFGIIVAGILFATIGTIAVFGASDLGTPESKDEGLTSPVQVIFFEPMEINVPVVEYDFSNEPPMLITPDMEH